MGEEKNSKTIISCGHRVFSLLLSCNNNNEMISAANSGFRSITWIRLSSHLLVRFPLRSFCASESVTARAESFGLQLRRFIVRRRRRWRTRRRRFMAEAERPRISDEGEGDGGYLLQKFRLYETLSVSELTVENCFGNVRKMRVCLIRSWFVNRMR